MASGNLPKPADLSAWWATVEAAIESLDDSFDGGALHSPNQLTATVVCTGKQLPAAVIPPAVTEALAADVVGLEQLLERLPVACMQGPGGSIGSCACDASRGPHFGVDTAFCSC